MRLFIAIKLPEEVKDELVRIENELSVEKAKVKWIGKDQMHLTLKFLGEVESDHFIKEILAKIKFKLFSFKLSKLGVFPSENYIRVVWVGINPSEEVVKLQKQVDESLKDLFPREKNFSSHITIGRVKFIENKPNFINALKNVEIQEKIVEVKEIKLVKSNLTKQGPIYEDIFNISTH